MERMEVPSAVDTDSCAARVYRSGNPNLDLREELTKIKC